MAPLRPLDPPHKGIRNALSQLGLAAGNTVAADEDAMAAFLQLGADVLAFLDEHAAFEEAYILAPLEARVPGAADRDRAAHHELEASIAPLRAAFCGPRAALPQEALDELAKQIAAFHAAYLLHMAEEEASTERQMMAHFSDEELIGHQIAIMAETSLPSLLRMFRFIAPARRLDENAQVLQALRVSAPPAVFDAVRDTLRAAMPEAPFLALMREVGG